MCENCKAMEGWIETETGALKRCPCRVAPKPAIGDPVLSAKDVEVFVEMLANVPYFPGESGARLLIGEEIRSMCRSAREALWLVTRMTRLYARWPGLRELRAVYCNGEIPLDGLMAIGISEVYPDGIPSEKPTAPLPLKALPPGPQSADNELDAAIKQLAARKAMR